MKYLRKDDFNPSLFHPYYFIRKNLFKHIKAKAPLLKGRLLDFGCGSKPYRALFSVDEYVGIDFENSGHSHDYEQIDVYYDGKGLPFENETFDSVLTTEVFEHLFNLPDILHELNRVLKPGGKMLITCPFVWNEHEVPYDYARYTRFALTDLLQKSGFQVDSFDKSGNFIITLFQLYNLYCFQSFFRIFKKIFLTRWLYYLLFCFLPNITGIVLNFIFPNNRTLYLNNIVVVTKSHE